jgi:hypothetical protein
MMENHEKQIISKDYLDVRFVLSGDKGRLSRSKSKPSLSKQ